MPPRPVCGVDECHFPRLGTLWMSALIDWIDRSTILCKKYTFLWRADIGWDDVYPGEKLRHSSQYVIIRLSSVSSGVRESGPGVAVLLCNDLAAHGRGRWLTGHVTGVSAGTISELKPSSWDKNFDGIAVWSTNKVPHKALRSSSRLRPGCCGGRSTFGNNGLIRSHSSSETIQERIAPLHRPAGRVGAGCRARRVLAGDHRSADGQHAAVRAGPRGDRRAARRPHAR